MQRTSCKGPTIDKKQWKDRKNVHSLVTKRMLFITVLIRAMERCFSVCSICTLMANVPVFTLCRLKANEDTQVYYNQLRNMQWITEDTLLVKKDRSHCIHMYCLSQPLCTTGSWLVSNMMSKTYDRNSYMNGNTNTAKMTKRMYKTCNHPVSQKLPWVMSAREHN